ncbi:unnamed protein product [Caenorhabditis bovis]|uniref:PH domain-containing protein n=1 Tax=Caenorhabditis bovis TaxID=2654633 RepID=A0A8S1E7V0_9PELO|nr:unnamed protein product [Caenorhabditis bovis]
MSYSGGNILYEGRLKRCMKYKIFKTKWIERYFVLYCRDSDRNLYALDEYTTFKKTELKNTFELENVFRLESNLILNDPSLACSSSSERLSWIFALTFKVNGNRKDLYLVANNKDDMNDWVRRFCSCCKLQRDTTIRRPYIISAQSASTSSVTGLSVSSDSLEGSDTEGNQNDFYDSKSGDNNYRNLQKSESESKFSNGGRKYSKKKQSSQSNPTSPMEASLNIFNQEDNGSQQRKGLISPEKARAYHNLRTFSAARANNTLPKDMNYSNLNVSALSDGREVVESCSETSSMYSGRKTNEDDANSTISGPPMPPPRVKNKRGMSTERTFAKNKQITRLNSLAASTSTSPLPTTIEDDSSSDTIKLNPTQTYAPSVVSLDSDAFNPKSPPPVDRTNKPKNLRSNDNVTNRRRDGDTTDIGTSTIRFTSFTRGTVGSSDISKRKNLDYFEPLTDGLMFTANSTRSPTPSDIEYITVDVDRTLAFKQMRRVE